MKFYKIRHKVSGLFYQPHRFGGIQLSKNGKVYAKKPPIKTYKDSTILVGYGGLGLGGSKNHYSCAIYAKFILSDWEIVEYQTRQVVVEW